ncbi:MAG: type II toxin-antitoxin system mRNA interferase toxin, RelE/StbE family [Sedimenticola sp.]
MTVVNSGGGVIKTTTFSSRFKRDRKKLDTNLRKRLDKKLEDLLSDPMPAGLAFEKLSGYRNPDIYTLHVTGNYKMSMAIEGSHATLRRVGTHNEIDRNP